MTTTVNEVRIGSPSSALLLSIDDDQREPPQFMIARLRMDSLQAERCIFQHYASGFHDLARFFESLERDWRGWPDIRTWASVSLIATELQQLALGVQGLPG